MGLIDFTVKGLCDGLGLMWPAYQSYKTLQQQPPVKDQQEKWLAYWVVMALIMLLEYVPVVNITLLPLYYHAKLLAILWLVLPQTQGAPSLYRWVAAYIADHEQEIDSVLSTWRQHIGSQLAVLSKQGALSAVHLLMEIVVKGQAVVKQYTQPQAEAAPASSLSSVPAAAVSPSDSSRPQPLSQDSLPVSPGQSPEGEQPANQQEGAASPQPLQPGA